MNPENRPAKVNWTLPWPSALEVCGIVFFDMDLISGLILWGKAWTLNFSIAFVKWFSFFSWLSRISSGKVCCNCEPWEQPTEVNWALSWPSAWKNCSSIRVQQGVWFFLDRETSKIVFQKKCSVFFLQQHLLDEKSWSAKTSYHSSEPPKHCRRPA